MSSTRRAAISSLAQAIVRPSASTSASSDVSCGERSPLSVDSTARTTSATRAGSASGCCSLISARRLDSWSTSAMAQHLLDLLTQGFGVERLDDVVRHAGLLGSDNVLYFAFCCHHDEGHCLQLGVCTNFLQQLQAGHWCHVPVADHKTETARPKFCQRLGPVGRFLDVVELNLL